MQIKSTVRYYLTPVTIFLVVLVFELRALPLLGQCSTTSVTLPALYALVIFQLSSHFCLGPALDCDPPT
jgi:hypothetical protein